MRLGQVRRGAGAALLVGSVALGGALVATPTPAQAAAENGNVDAYGSVSAGSPCTVPAGPADPEPVLTDNGGWATDSYTRAGAVMNGATKVADVSTTATVRARITPLLGGPARFDVVLSGTATRSAVSGTACTVSVWSSAYTDFDYVVTQPMWASLGASSTGGKGTTSIAIYPDDAAADGSAAVLSGGKSAGSSSVLLRPGRYRFEAQGGAGASGPAATPVSESFNGSVWATLTPVGYASSGAVGKAARFVKLAGAVDCTRHTVGASVAKKARKKAEKIKLFVNGKKRLTLKGKRLKKASSVAVPGIAPTGAASVKAVVTLKNGKKVTVSRSYLACS